MLRAGVAISVVALAACGGEDFSPEGSGAASSASASSSSGNSGTGGGTAGSGAGGSATGGGGPICAGSAVCVPAAPDGWEGPTALWLGNDAPPECDSGWMTASTAHEGMVSGDVSCEACTCGVPSMEVCGVPAVTIYSSNSCGGIVNNVVPKANGGCTTIPSTFSMRATAAEATGGSCATQGGSPTLGEIKFENAALLCNEPKDSEACGKNGVCAPPAPAGGRLCVAKHGDEPSCPGEYPDRAVIYAGVADTRGCTACSCGAPKGATCVGVLGAYLATDCAGNKAPIAQDGSCVNNNISTWTALSYVPGMYIPGACSPSGGVVTGEVSPMDPTTVCCHQ